MNLLAVPIEDLSVLDRHVGGRLRQTLYEIVGAHLEPDIDVARERHEGKSRWFLLVRGRDAHGVVQREERFEIQLGPRYEEVIAVATKIHMRAYTRELRDELSAIYAGEFAPEDDEAESEVTGWPSRRPPGRPS